MELAKYCLKSNPFDEILYLTGTLSQALGPKGVFYTFQRMYDYDGKVNIGKGLSPISL